MSPQLKHAGSSSSKIQKLARHRWVAGNMVAGIFWRLLAGRSFKFSRAKHRQKGEMKRTERTLNRSLVLASGWTTSSFSDGLQIFTRPGGQMIDYKLPVSGTMGYTISRYATSAYRESVKHTLDVRNMFSDPYIVDTFLAPGTSKKQVRFRQLMGIVWSSDV